MARRPIDEYWRQRVCLLTENEPGLSARAMAKRLEKEAEAKKRDDSPSERWVRKEQVAFRSRQLEERIPYRQFTWPESMGAPDLPWEASAAALELLREHHKRNFPRPVLALVQWFWRVTMAVPALSFGRRFELATFLHGCEVGGAAVSPVSWRRVEARIASDEWPDLWFGEQVGENLAITVGQDGLAEIIVALNPMLSLEAATALVRFLNERCDAREAGVQ